jgi:hypothetical protein
MLGAEDVHLERLPGGADVVAVWAREAGREHVARLHVFAHHGLIERLIGAAGAAVAAPRLHAVVEALDQVVQLAHVCNRQPLFYTFCDLK